MNVSRGALNGVKAGQLVQSYVGIGINLQDEELIEEPRNN